MNRERFTKPMDVRPIRTERDYTEARAAIERLWEAEPGTREYDRLDVIATLVDAYEDQHHRQPPPDPVDAIRLRMGQLGLDRKDLEPLIGPRERVSDVLARRRGLSLAMIRRLHRRLGISADILIAGGKRRVK
jgi:HTH-type transcriptional regulator / antitoxin HigA